MMHDFSISIHYRNREIAERLAARSSIDPMIRTAHETMAHHYAQLIKKSSLGAY